MGLSEIDALSLKIPVLLKALYFKGIASIRKMLATQKDLGCLIQPTSILSRDPRINNWLTSFFTNSDSSVVDCCPIENSNQICNQRGSELKSLVEQGKKGGKLLPPALKAKDQKFVQMPQAAKISPFTADRDNPGALTTPFKIKFFVFLSHRIYLEASPFVSGGGVSKHP
ncbi:hypothetical protein [Microcoleus sp. Pol12B4]|uniref:hypothetical protein n=1 Tax=Microcoleus sp. Pol12B4 TaxID=3055395 RepID=UPI002FD16FE6